jgi:hypothetical protein
MCNLYTERLSAAAFVGVDNPIQITAGARYTRARRG